MTENRNKTRIIGDRWLIVVALIVVFITAWNSRSAMLSTPNGYTSESKDSVYCTFFGGTSSDQIRDITLDSEGNIIIVGGTHSQDFPVKKANQATYNSGGVPEEEWFSEENWFWLMGDGFVSKFSSEFNLEWSTYIGGSDLDIAYHVLVDSNDNILVFGQTMSADFPVSDGSSYSGGEKGNAFITRFTPDGELIESIYYASGENVLIRDVDKDHLGNIVLAGETTSTEFYCTEDAKQSSLRGEADGFIRVITEALDTVIYSTLVGGDVLDGISKISVSETGYIHAGGYTQSSDFPVTENALFPDYNGGDFDGFIMSMTPNRQFDLLTYLGGSDHEDVFGLDTNVAGSEIVVVGRTKSTDFPVTGDEFWEQPRDLEVRGFLCSLSGDGELLNSNLFGLNNWDSITLVNLDNQNNTIIAGFVLSSGFETMNAFQPDFMGVSDIVVIIRGEETELFSYLGGSMSEHPFAQCVSNGKIYLVGNTASEGFPVSEDAFQLIYGGNEDGFIWVLDYWEYLSK